MTKTILFNIIICQWGKGQVVGGNNIPVGKGNTFSGGIVSVGKTSRWWKLETSCRWGKRHKLVEEYVSVGETSHNPNELCVDIIKGE